jgi:hypothetical protein
VEKWKTKQVSYKINVFLLSIATPSVTNIIMILIVKGTMLAGLRQVYVFFSYLLIAIDASGF